MPRPRSDPARFVGRTFGTRTVLAVLRDVPGRPPRLHVRCTVCREESHVRPADLTRGVGCRRCYFARSRDSRFRWAWSGFPPLVHDRAPIAPQETSPP